ncbi:MAG TPA: CHRD domain-containing protein [Longimicrobiaceae bacterium]
MLKTVRYAALALLLPLALTACDDDDDDGAIVYRAELSGASEVPPRTTSATGVAEFRLSDNDVITYTVDVTGLSNIAAGHIHGPASTTTNAGVIIGLFSTPPSTSPFTGRLAEGTINRSSTLNGVDFDGLVNLLETGQAYVNIHTNDGVDPPDTGPGDFPGGEIRGQILRR